MHSKYMVIDDRFVYSGSFNWSYSSEYYNLENVIVIDGSIYPKPLTDFKEDFDRLFKLNRNDFFVFKSQLENALETGSTIKCNFLPTVLAYSEIDHFLSLGTKYNKSLKEGCL